MSLSAKDSELSVTEFAASSETVTPETLRVASPDVAPPLKPVPAITLPFNDKLDVPATWSINTTFAELKTLPLIPPVLETIVLLATILLA